LPARADPVIFAGMVWFLAGVVTLVLLVGAFNRFARASRAERGKAGAIAVVTLLAVFGVLLLVTGKIFAALPALGSAAAGLWRRRWLAKLLAGPAVRKAAKAGASAAAAKAGAGSEAGSRIRTRFLDVSRDEASGRLEGEVRAGRFAGRSISGLDFGEALALLAQLETQDLEGARLLERYLDTAFGSDWRARSQHYGYKARSGGDSGGGGSGGMSREEALEVLGLEPDAAEAEIKAAHRELIKRMHPDAGGSSYFASKLNQAKTVLLEARRRR